MSDVAPVGEPGSPVDLLFGSRVEVVGIQDETDGALRVYLKHRSLGLYAIVEPGLTADAIRREWADISKRLLIPWPPRSACGDESLDVRETPDA